MKYSKNCNKSILTATSNELQKIDNNYQNVEIVTQSKVQKPRKNNTHSRNHFPINLIPRAEEWVSKCLQNKQKVHLTVEIRTRSGKAKLHVLTCAEKQIIRSLIGETKMLTRQFLSDTVYSTACFGKHFDVRIIQFFDH